MTYLMRKQSQHHSSSSRSQLASLQRNVCDLSTKTLSVNYKSDPKVGSHVKVHVHTHTRETAGSVGCSRSTCSDVCWLKIGKTGASLSGVRMLKQTQLTLCFNSELVQCSHCVITDAFFAWESFAKKRKRNLVCCRWWLSCWWCCCTF